MDMFAIAGNARIMGTAVVSIQHLQDRAKEEPAGRPRCAQLL